MKRILRVMLTILLIVLILAGEFVGRGRNIKADTKLGLGYIIVVANPSLKDTVQDFVKFKESQGFDVIVEDVPTIEQNYQGVDRAEKIRNFLKDKTKDYSKTFTLLIGTPYDKNQVNFISSGGDIPMRIIYPPQIYSNVKGDYFPTDFYYADLEGDWDANGDGVYGAKDDNIIYKVNNFVGRIPFSDNKTVEKILSNTITLSNTPLTYKVLLTGTNWSNDVRFDKAKYMENARLNILEPHGFSAITLYEKEGKLASIYPCTAPLNRNNFIKYLSGNDIIVTDGHNGLQRGVWYDTNGDGKIDNNEMNFIPFFTQEDLITTQFKTKIWYDFGCATAFGSWNIYHENTLVPADTILAQGMAAVVIGETGIAYDAEIDVNSLFDTLIVARRPIGEWLYNKEFQRQDIYGNKINELKSNILGDPSFGLFDDSLTISADVTPPLIQIVTPINGTLTKDSTVTVSGTITDDLSGIQKVMVGKQSVILDTNGSFTTNIILNEGPNDISIIATDKAGNSSTVSLTIYYKWKQMVVLTLTIGNPYLLVNLVPQEIDPGRGTTPIIKNDRTLVPIRAIVEALGGKVDWEATERKVTIVLNSTTIELWIGKSTAKVNGIDNPIDTTNPKVVPEIINNRTMLPLRFIAENLGCDVQWDGMTKTITIIYRGG